MKLKNSRADLIIVITAGLMVLVAVGYVAYKIFTGTLIKRHVDSVVNVDAQARINSEWKLGNFAYLSGTDYLMAAVYSEQDYQMTYSSKEATAVRNYLFINATDKSSRWLIPHHKYLFLRSQNLLRPDEERSDKAVIKWIRYEVVKADTNGDGRLTSDDRRTIAFSNAAGEGYAEIIQNVDEVLGSHLRDENTWLEIYKSGDKNFVAEINLPQHQITVTKDLPPIQSQ